MSGTIDSDQHLQSVWRRLRTWESIIVSLLDRERISYILEEKIFQAEELLVYLSNGSSLGERKLFREWLPKLTSWYKQYALIELQQMDALMAKNAGASVNQNKGAILSAVESKYPPLVPEKAFDDQLSKEYLASQLEDVFAEVDEVTSDADLIGMQHLVSVIVRSLDLLPPTRNEPTLQARIFRVVSGKLPKQMRALFYTQYEPPHSLYSLFHYLRLEIDDYCDNNKLLLQSDTIDQSKPGSSQKNNAGDDNESMKTKADENNNNNNDEGYKSEFCFRCYDFGHRTNRCNQPTLASKGYRIAL